MKVNTPRSLQLAIQDLVETFGAKYPRGQAYLARLGKLQTRLASGDKTAAAELDALAREALLANPLLDFDHLIVRRTADLGLPANWQSNSSLGRANYDNEIATLSPVGPGGKLRTLYHPESKADFLGDIDLHFDAGKLLFSQSRGHASWSVCELALAPSTAMALSATVTKLPLPSAPGVNSYDACYLADDNVLFASTAAMTGVPCVGGKSPVTNLYRLERDTGTIRRLTFDQDHDWYPAMMNSGRVMYLRWEYSDITHAFSRILFSMNPDGTNQMAHYVRFGQFSGSEEGIGSGLENLLNSRRKPRLG